MKISDVLPGWTPAALWASRSRTFTTRGLALAQISIETGAYKRVGKMGREACDLGIGPRSPRALQDIFRTPDGKYYQVSIREVSVDDDQLRAEVSAGICGGAS